MKYENDLQRYILWHGQIDLAYYQLQLICEYSGKMETPLEAMIDKATGFDKVKAKENIKAVKALMAKVIRYKKLLGYDVTNDEKFRQEVLTITVKAK